MKKIVFFAMITAISLSAIAQKKVAVYVTGEQSGVTKIMGDQLVSAFSRSAEYSAIERTNSFLAELSKEQTYQRSGAVDDKEISRLGKQFGVQYVCVADISEAFGKKYVSARLINVENAEVISTANEYSNLDSMEELIRVSTVLKGQLLGNQKEQSSIPAGYVDLGLPSGTLWAKQCLSESMNYKSALELCRVREAQIPDANCWTELQTECTWTKKGGGYEVKGKNGNTIYISHTRHFYDNKYFAEYWTSSCSEYNKKSGECDYNFYICINPEGAINLKSGGSLVGAYNDFYGVFLVKKK